MDTQHRFKDEWLLKLVGDQPTITPELVMGWRGEKRPYLAQVLVDKGVIGVRELMDLVYKAFRIQAFDPAQADQKGKVTSILPEKVCRQYDLYPSRSLERSIEVAMSNPVDMEAMENVSWTTGREVIPLYCLPSQLGKLMEEHFTPHALVYDLAKRFQQPEEVEILSTRVEEDDGAGVADKMVMAPVVRLANAIIADAVRRGASDIHIEHEEKTSLVRFRIDGQLKNIMEIPRYLGAGPLVARIKIMSTLDVTVRFHPQDGRAKLRVGQEEVGLRVSTLPTRIGEKVVIRILDERASQVPFEALGFRLPVRERLEALLERDQGIILVTGPTGSGKTTTLYSALNRVKAEGINIITIEDPIEYRLEHVSQVQVDEKKGLTFPAVLRSVLRQDPDIVMVGEIRDKETAEIACQAALTGHLVFSTLHTNDTVSTVTRLADMGVDGFKIAAGVLGITAQRLVRRLCTQCSRPAATEEMDPEIRRRLARYQEEPRVFEAQGCENCGFSGYKGRIGIVELLLVTPKIREAISREASAEELRRLALAAGALQTLEEDIFHHLQEGHTSVEEILPHLDLTRLDEAPEKGDIRATPGPRTSAPPPVSESRAVVPEAPKEGSSVPRILLAESDGAVRGPLADLLLEAGLAVEESGDGSKALQFAAKNPVDLLMVGANIPGIDGKSLIQAVRGVLGLINLPILALVPRGEDQVAEDMVEAGADDFISTPLHPKLAMGRVRAALGRQNGWLSVEEAMRPKIPLQEADRMAAVKETGLLDTPPEERFDRITRKAREHFGVPVSYVAVVDADRQWFKSKQGLKASETPREVAFCAHAINEEGPLVIPDSSLDPRFAENPLATGPENVRFYAGVPIRSPEGQAVGTFCIVDHQPREMTPDELATLEGMAKEVEDEIWR